MVFMLAWKIKNEEKKRRGHYLHSTLHKKIHWTFE